MKTGTQKSYAAAVVSAALLAGCGGGDSNNETVSPPAAPPPAAAGQTLRLAADESALAFDKKTLTAKAGQVTLVMSNPSSIPHNVAIEGSNVDELGEVVGKGGTSTVSASLRPGKYTYYCSVGGHREAGMLGTLTVR
jgi:plastocyanin